VRFSISGKIWEKSERQIPPSFSTVSAMNGDIFFVYGFSGVFFLMDLARICFPNQPSFPGLFPQKSFATAINRYLVWYNISALGVFVD
jgi:hypothetical protein